MFLMFIKSSMWKHKMAKNMFPTYTKRHIFEQLDILHARRMCVLAILFITFICVETDNYVIEN